jgi:hypothetical protein
LWNLFLRFSPVGYELEDGLYVPNSFEQKKKFSVVVSSMRPVTAVIKETRLMHSPAILTCCFEHALVAFRWIDLARLARTFFCI